MEEAEDIEAVCRAHDLDLVVLFGSRARGDARADSDSDLGVLRRSGTVPARDRLRLGFQLGRALQLPNVDLVDLHTAPPLLKHQVGSSGRVLYEREPGLFRLFRVYAWKLYLDDERQLRALDAQGIRAGLDRLKA